MKYSLYILLGLFNVVFSNTISEKLVVFVVPSYNNIAYFERNLQSLFLQEYKNYRIIYIDDQSTDGTADAVEKFVQDCNQGSRFKLIRNQNRKGALENIFNAIHSCEDDAIVAIVDGDDWLYHPDVLNQLNQVYSSGEVWLTHGKMIEYPSDVVAWSIPIPQEYIKGNDFRSFRCPSHLRTFYAWLFKNINQSDLKYEGKFFEMTGDMAIMFPMIEMAGERHAFIDEVNYVYNMKNPINDNKVNPELQNLFDRKIRGMPRYNRLEGRPTN